MTHDGAADNSVVGKLMEPGESAAFAVMTGV